MSTELALAPTGATIRIVGASLLGLAAMHQVWRRLSAQGARAASAVATPPAFAAALSGTVVISGAEEAAASKRRLGAAPLIGTHDGTFHCDEALACAMLKALPRFQDAIVVRTRDPKVLEECDIVVDVGAVYDAAKSRFDHHQRGFTDVLQELGHATKLSSAGLVFRHFGAEAISALASASASASSKAPLDEDALRRRVYKNFIEHIDGIDNGIEAHDGKKNYEVSTTLSARVAALNPRWNEPSEASDSNVRFRWAMELVGAELAAAVEAATNSWWPARALVAAALDNARTAHASRQILELGRACPWPSHLFELEQERAAAGDKQIAGAAKYVVFPDSKGGWRVQAVPVEEDSFTTRRPLPEPWRGVRDEKLSALLGLEGCIFVHAGGFIGGHATREGALAMARMAIEQ